MRIPIQCLTIGVALCFCVSIEAKTLAEQDILEAYSQAFLNDRDVTVKYIEDVVVTPESKSERLVNVTEVIKHKGRWNVTRDVTIYSPASHETPDYQQRHLRINNDAIAASTVYVPETDRYNDIYVDDDPKSPFYTEIGDLGFGSLLFGRDLLPPNKYLLDSGYHWAILAGEDASSEGPLVTSTLVSGQDGNRIELTVVVISTGEIVPSRILIARKQRIDDKWVDVTIDARIEKLGELDGRPYIATMTGQFKRTYPDGHRIVKNLTIEVEEIKTAHSVEDRLFTISALGAPEGSVVRYIDEARKNSGVRYVWQNGSIVTDVNQAALDRLNDSLASHSSSRGGGSFDLMIRIAGCGLVLIVGLAVLMIVWRRRRG